MDQKKYPLTVFGYLIYEKLKNVLRFYFRLARIGLSKEVKINQMHFDPVG